jgi:hypothetical protein
MRLKGGGFPRPNANGKQKDKNLLASLIFIAAPNAAGEERPICYGNCGENQPQRAGERRR